MPPLLIGAAISGVSSIVGGVLGSNAAKTAAQQQQANAQKAIAVEQQNAQKAQDYQQNILGGTTQNLQPYAGAGRAALGNLDYLLGVGPQGAAPAGAGGDYGSLSRGWTGQFQAPTAATEQNDPGYQFRLQQGTNALQNSAAARGTLLSGGTAAGINAYGQDYASNEYGNVYGRALGQYQQSYQQFMNNQANQYSRLSGQAQQGLQAGSELGQFGQAAAGNTGNILMGSARDIGQQYSNIGAAQAAGTVGSANAYQGMLGNIGNLASQTGMAQSFLNQQQQNQQQDQSGYNNQMINSGPW